MPFVETKSIKTIGIIPARYASTRFPGKPLIEIYGKPMIQWTYEHAKEAQELDKLVVATDDQRIADRVKWFGGKVIMTSPSCQNGTERCWNVIQQLEEEGESYDYVINIQGDEPLVNPNHIDKMVRDLKESPCGYGLVSLAAPIRSESDWRNPHLTKVVMDQDNFALYYSRAPIPYSKSGIFSPETTKYYQNCGMYCFRRDFLALYCLADLTPLQREEDLEQLKVLEMGQRIKVVKVERVEGGVDLPEQVEGVKEILERRDRGGMMSLKLIRRKTQDQLKRVSNKIFENKSK